jgi:hypothetical protein
LRFRFVCDTDEGFVVLYDNETGEQRIWQRGFTYKAWICAQTGNVIKASTDEGKVWAWRLAYPRKTKEYELRIADETLK